MARKNKVGHLGLELNPRIVYNADVQNPIESLSLYHKYLRNEKNSTILNIDKKINTDNRILDEIAIPSSSGNSPFNLVVSSRLKRESVIDWYIYFANMHGRRKANYRLEKFYGNQEYVSLVSLWVSNIEVKQIIDLGGGIKIYPAKEMPLSRQSARFSNPKFEDGIWDPHAALAIQTSLAIGDSALDIFPSIQQKLTEVAHIISLLKKVPVSPIEQRAYPLNCPASFIDGGGVKYLRRPADCNPVLLSNEDGESVRGLLQSMNKLANDDKKLVIASLERIDKAKHADDIGNKLLDLCIAIEMILLNGTDNNQLSLQFRLHGALILGKGLDKRQEYQDKLHELYNHRCAVAHNGELRSKGNSTYKFTKANSLSIETHFDTFLDLAREIVMYLIENGLPDWDKIRLTG